MTLRLRFPVPPCFGLLALMITTPVAGAELERARLAFQNSQYAEAYELFSKGEAEGDTESAYLKARMIELGLSGNSASPQSAGAIYLRGAAQGHAPSMNRVGLMYFRGDLGIARNDRQALGYFERAARAGNANALFNLSRFHLLGTGVTKNEAEALRLMRQAADKDHVLALNTLGAILAGRPDTRDRKHARAYFLRSAALGNAVGLFQTGLYALHDGGTRENLRLAHRYFNLASARGHPEARRVLTEITAQLSEEDRLIAQSQARDFRAQDPKTGE
ncbi:sel1 repeat family protein [Rhizobium oryzihabitans]|uniref:Sel1 repeat family protein n=1 Tax=Rhizobium oryzihabitans TaxID=2267833 RepID=A0A7L5BPB7_9HYPH|nr:tetratricopeptide repeat protein [Rhizobium oryzihabitans]QCM07776.1 sel1 repeat family protein [Agrobacterium tumefaciens]QIB40760.1 sel1 repeat family protein [Rhizobium oryzihabitans]CUX53199.1 Sel1 domain-containing protein repeat-containing protein [Agrobacterium genomosp. 5 str. CFBP 6626]